MGRIIRNGTEYGGRYANTILDSSGNIMPQEPDLQFASGCVEDDPVNGKTIYIEMIRISQANYDTLKANGQLKPGAKYFIYDAQPVAVNASNLPYSSSKSTKQKIDEIDEDIIVFEFTTTLNFVQNTWTWQTLSTDASQTIPTGYKVVSAFATTNYPHADLVIPNIQEGKGHYGFMTYGTRTLSNLAVTVRAVCKKI